MRISGPLELIQNYFQAASYAANSMMKAVAGNEVVINLFNAALLLLLSVHVGTT